MQVDAFQLSDNQLNSCLGRYDGMRMALPVAITALQSNSIGFILHSKGNVYETMFAWAKKEPLNKKEVIACGETQLFEITVAGCQRFRRPCH